MTLDYAPVALDDECARRIMEGVARRRLGLESALEARTYAPVTDPGAERMACLRQQLGMSQRDLARALGYSGHGAISMAERGHGRQGLRHRAVEWLEHEIARQDAGTLPREGEE